VPLLGARSRSHPAPWDKLAHLAVFAALTTLLWIGTAGRMPFAFAVVATAIAIGAFDELHQASQRHNGPSGPGSHYVVTGITRCEENRAVKRLPLPGSLSISSFAWCRNRACFTIASPSPVPPLWRDWSRSTR